MNFQDALKAAAKTPEELETERVDALSVKAEEEAIKVMKYAKRTLEKMASNAEYEEIDGKKVVSSLEPVMPDFFRHVKDDYKEVLNEEHYGFMGKNVKYMWTCTHNFYIEDNPVWTVFWDTVQKLAKQDNITVVPVYSYEPEFSNFIFNTEREHKIYMESDFPLTFQKQSQGNNTHPFGVVKSQEEHCYFLFKFRIKVTCEIPDAYSSDHPVEIFNNSDSENATTPHPDAVNSIKVSDNTISIDNVEGHEFEYLCADLLSKNGYEDVTVTQGSADQGIDVIAQRDGIKFGIQCKCYSSDIGNKAVQEAYAGKDFYKCHVGIVLTNRYFTRSAVELAKSNGIVLWNREKLLEFVKGAGYEVR